MKNLFLYLTLIVSLSVKSQITLEHTFPSSFQKFSTSSSGDFYFTSSLLNTGSGTNDTVTIYNIDWSIRRVVILPTGSHYVNFGVGNGYTKVSMCDKLFNNDTLIEFMGGTTVFNELGQTVYTFPSTFNVPYIYEVNGSYKLYVSNTNGYQIYSLPGTLPCNQCNSLSTGLVGPNGGNLDGLSVYPNPFSGSLNVEYHLTGRQDNPRLILSDIEGREIRTVQLVNQSDKVSINTSDLSKGTIVISLYNGGQLPVNQKVIKID